MCNAHCAHLCRYDLFLIVSKTNVKTNVKPMAKWVTSTHGCWIVQLAKLNCRAEDGREQHQMASVPSVPHRSCWTSGIWPRWLLNVYFYPVSTCMAGFYWFEKNYIYLMLGQYIQIYFWRVFFLYGSRSRSDTHCRPQVVRIYCLADRRTAAQWPFCVEFCREQRWPRQIAGNLRCPMPQPTSPEVAVTP